MPIARPYRLLAPDFGRLRASFPIPAAIAVGAAALAVVGSSDDLGVILMIAAAAWPAALAASLYAQARGAGRAVGLAAQLVAGLAATGLALAGQSLGLSVQHFFAGLALLCLTAPASRLREPDSYWVWAERFCVAAVFAAAVGLVGWLASVATLFSAEHLFNLFGSDLTGRLAINFSLVFFVAVAPVTYLAIQPPITDETLAADE
jgi:hypothetical protein